MHLRGDRKAAHTLDLSRHFDCDGISYETNPADGSFNIWGNTFPAEDLPEPLTVVEVDGVPFRWPDTRDGACNNVRCAGQLVQTPEVSCTRLALLGAAERRTEDPVYLHHVHGAVEVEWLRLSDFWPETPSRFGEMAAFECNSMHYPRHVQRNMRPVIWLQSVPVPRPAPLRAVRLPDNPAMHVFAMTLVGEQS